MLKRFIFVLLISCVPVFGGGLQLERVEDSLCKGAGGQKICCKGYEEKGGYCHPVCDAPCVHGSCVKPNRCECDSGYKVKSLHECVPRCSKLCKNGKCVAPETCLCNEGYEMNATKGTCTPKCPTGCKNGWCLRPGKCGCNSGYEMNENNECIPVCTLPCTFAECVAPDTCQCLPGYEKSLYDVSICEPKCTNECKFGTCVGPETCECFPEFRLTADNHTCEPICSKPCVNGFCAHPEECRCHLDYIRQDAFTCKPVCHKSCDFGECIGPDICSCNLGYEWNTERGRCEPVCDGQCEHGRCVEPNVCICDSGYLLSSLNRCIPVCNDTCIDGKCVGPDKCECDDGYILGSDDHTCKPVCSKPCVNGYCVKPNVCVYYPRYSTESDRFTSVNNVLCAEGYELDKTNTNCNPVCSSGCVNGWCAEPNLCACDKGYTLNEFNECDAIVDLPLECNEQNPESCLQDIPPDSGTSVAQQDQCTEPCIHGKCTALETCTCDYGYTKSSESIYVCEAMDDWTCSTVTCFGLTNCTCHDYLFSNDEVSRFCLAPVPRQLASANDSTNSAATVYAQWEDSICRSECLDELDEKFTSNKSTIANEIYYFFPKDARCNVNDDVGSPQSHVESYITTGASAGVAAGILVIILVVMILCTIKLSRRNHPTKTKESNEHVEFFQENPLYNGRIATCDKCFASHDPKICTCQLTLSK